MIFKMKEQGFTSEFEYGELHISGNEEYGFRPFQLLVSSVAVCSGGVLKSVLIKKRFAVEDIEVHADVTRNPEQANRIEKIHLHFLVKAEGLAEGTLEKAIEVTRKNCPIVQSVQGSIEITESFELNS